MQFKVRGDCLHVFFYTRRTGVLFSTRFSDVPSEGPTPFAHLQNKNWGVQGRGLDAASTCQRIIFPSAIENGRREKKLDTDLCDR